MATMKTDTTKDHSYWNKRARAILAKCIPHTTSVHNVTILGDDLEKAYDEGYRKCLEVNNVKAQD